MCVCLEFCFVFFGFFFVLFVAVFVLFLLGFSCLGFLRGGGFGVFVGFLSSLVLFILIWWLFLTFWFCGFLCLFYLFLGFLLVWGFFVWLFFCLFAWLVLPFFFFLQELFRLLEQNQDLGVSY